MDKSNISILVVEDDETLAQMLQLNLDLEGYQATVAYSAEEALKLDISSFSLILLDVMMGAMSGFALARKLKADAATSSIPIIFCTARDNEDDMVRGLGLGADDYIFKPYTLRNVLARIEAVLRRSSNSMVDSEETDYKIVFEGLVVDGRLKQCTVDGRNVDLVKKEFEILDLLLRNRGRIFSREEILDRVWHGDVVVLARTVDVNITRIRRKTAPYGEHIKTRAGYGYGFC